VTLKNGHIENPAYLTIKQPTRRNNTMNISAFIKMNSNDLSVEIEKQKKKIKTANETIKLLEKLQIAENAKSGKPISTNSESEE
jgi:hypothetical protein